MRVNIITGALGVGKTTAIQQLLRSKPPGERWAVLVNEFGALGDTSTLSDPTVVDDLIAQRQNKKG